MVPFFFGFFLRMKDCFNSAPVGEKNEQIGYADGAVTVQVGRTNSLRRAWRPLGKENQ